MKISLRNIIFFLFLIGIFIVGMFILKDSTAPIDKFQYSDLQDYLDHGLVQHFELDEKYYLHMKAYVPERDADGNLILSDKPEDQLIDDQGNVYVKALYKMENGKPKVEEISYRLSMNFQMEEVNEKAAFLYKNGWMEDYNYKEIVDKPAILSYLPYFILLIGIIFLYVFMYRQASGKGRGNSFARAHTKTASSEKNPVKFADVAGADEEKAELQEVVEFRRNPGKFVRLGARIPRGVLLVGPPGTGKTLLAKAVAGEAGVPFYSISGSDFVEMYVGVGASRVRDLFNTARKSPASIIFIDEIDAVGRHRGAGLGGGHDEREQTLNQLLVEMDGFGNQEGVIVMAATNRPDILDPALLRPGRFDRQVTVNYPDLRGREAILHVHVRNKPLEANVDLHKIAQTTVGFTGADLANLLNEAALLAARRGKALIGMPEIEAATLKVIVGTEKKNKGISEKDRKLTAYHEAGHAIVCHRLPGTDPVTRISIIPTNKGAGGYTLMPPASDKSYEFKSEMMNDIAISVAGRAAEEIIFGDYTGGASSDIRQATRTAKRMVTVYGMSDELGTVNLAGDHSGDEVFLGRDFSSGKEYSEETAAKIDHEIKAIIDRARKQADQILTAEIDKMHLIVEYLMQYEVMDGEQFRALMDEDATLEQLCEIANERERRSREENEAAQREAEERAQREAEEAAARQENDPYRDFMGKDDSTLTDEDGKRRF